MKPEKNNQIYDDELLNEKQKTPLFEFAFCGTADVFQNHLKNLAELAEPEPWCYENRKDDPLSYIKILHI